jgi:hypothetical protein
MGINEKSQGVHSCLETNVMVLNQNEKFIFLVSIDTLFISKDLKDFIITELKNYYESILDTYVIILSTHTHYAPSLEEKRIDLGTRDNDYFLFLKEKISDLFKLLDLEYFSEIELEVSSGISDNLTSNRRRKVRSLKDIFNPFIAMEPNLKGYKKEEFKIIKISNANSEGQTLGVIWTFPCHPTNLYDKNLVSAEFPGFVRNDIRIKQKKEELPIIYMPGFAGNIRAYPPKRVSLLKLVRDIFQLSYPVVYYRFKNKVEYNNWVNSLTNSFWVVWGKLKKIEKINDSILSSKMNKKDISLLGINVDGVDNIIFRKISIGNELAFYTMSAETVSEYSKIMDKIANEDFIIYTGYADEVFGYLPTQVQINEGGYESKEYFKPFFVSGNFNSSIENIIESCVQEIN